MTNGDIKFREDLAKAYSKRPYSPIATDSLDEVYEDLKLTEWDKQIFRLTGFDPKSDFDDPFLQISFTVDMNRFQLFWQRDVLSLADCELDELFDACNEVYLHQLFYEGIEVDSTGQIGNFNTIAPKLKDPKLMKRRVVDL